MKSVGPVVATAFLATMLAALAGCDYQIQYPVPSLSSLSPSSVKANSPTFKLTVSGSNFVFGASILWNGTAIQTFFINSNEVQATVDESNVTTPGTQAVVVQNPSPGGGNSNTLNFTVNPSGTPIPKITSIQPAGAQVSGAAFTLTVNGVNFTTTSVVTWSGANRATTFVNSGEIQASILDADLQSAGTFQVAVLNPTPGGGLSNAISFQVANPQPVISSISPTASIADGPAFGLTVNGTGFVCATFTTNSATGAETCTSSGSTVNWNGLPQATAFQSSTQLIASISTADLGAAGTTFVTVTNPAPGGGTSAAALYQVIPGANGEGLPSLVDVSSGGSQANAGIGHLGQSGPAIAGGGRYIAFSSISQNLVPNLANGVANVFVADTCLGISVGCTPRTVLASLANNAEPPDADCLQPSISSDGRFVVYASAATDLAAGATGGVSQIYLSDTCLGASGCTPSTTLLSVAPDGVTPANGSSSQPSISPDSQYVVFVSTATNLGTASTGSPQVYLRSTCVNATTSCKPATILASLAPDGVTAANGGSSSPVVASGGRFLAFLSAASNLSNIPTGGTQELFWRDTCIGAAACTPVTTLVSIGADGASAGNAQAVQPAISADGRFVVFGSAATNLLPTALPPGTPQQVFERDMCAGASGCTPATTLVSVAADGSSPANNTAENPSADQSGRYVLYSSLASNLTAAAANGIEQIFGRDTCLGASNCSPRTVLVSVAADHMTQANGAALYPAISTQAHFAAFLSFANNLVGDDTTPALEDIFLAVTTF